MSEWQAIADIGESVSGAIAAVGCTWAFFWFLVRGMGR